MNDTLFHRLLQESAQTVKSSQSKKEKALEDKIWRVLRSEGLVPNIMVKLLKESKPGTEFF